ncbi:MAG: tripartite tricarboxylate transporter substrate binding protein [Burkholderiales bacterium]|nr:tripartite tricarboxylate transporter substrate binding protein [Burkholderiales bacterium]
MNRRRDLLRAAAAGTVLTVLPRAVPAQAAYPSRPIRVIVPFGPGGVTDVLARLLSAEIAKDFGQPVVVENMPGGTGIIGSGAVAKAAPDGHTILFTSNAHTINPALRKQMPFDSVRDFTPLVLLAASPNMLVVRADSPIRSVADYIAAAKARPGEINFATSGVGTSLHIAGEQFAQITGTRYNHVPYAASNQSVQAVLGGHVVSSWSAINSALPFVKAGRMRALAVASERRSDFAPDVPTFAELGVKGMKSETWLAALGPAGLPAPVAAKLAAALQALIVRPDIRQKILGLGAEPVGTELEKFRAQIREEIELYTGIARAGDIKAE